MRNSILSCRRPAFSFKQFFANHHNACTSRPRNVVRRRDLFRGTPNKHAQTFSFWSTIRNASSKANAQKWSPLINGGKRRKGILIGTSILAGSPLVFVAQTESKVSENVEDQDQDQVTSELRLLEISDKEIADSHAISKDAPWPKRYFKKIQRALREWIWEPIATGIRFVHLASIFIPVIILVPLVWIGERQPNKDHERSGTLWWYGFLIKSMERAGPTFIKVCLHFEKPTFLLET